MSIGKAFRAWSGSVVTCVVLWGALWAIGKSQLDGIPTTPEISTERLERALAAFSIVSAVAFAIAATFVYIPAFILLDRGVGRPLTRTRAMIIGAILALAPRVLIAWTFEEAGSATAWVIHWARNLPQFPLAVLPFAVAGAVFGGLWCRKQRGATNEGT